jgi:putative ABC transport system ATP-binding protein
MSKKTVKNQKNGSNGEASKKETQRLVQPIDIKKVEKQLGEKKARSHHVVLAVERLFKSFLVGGNRVQILKDISLRIYSGEFAILYGPSGCGKSTFLHSVLGLEKPTRGKVKLRGKDLYLMKIDKRRNYRREKLGMVFQQSNWIKSLNVWENVAYPLWLSGYKQSESRERAMEVLAEVGMEKLAGQRPMELSGGQQQRVALARALSTRPWMLIADEPTGNLDTKSSEEIITLLAKLNREQSRVILMVTHEVSFLPLASRRIGMQDGRIVYDAHD